MKGVPVRYTIRNEKDGSGEARSMGELQGGRGRRKLPSGTKCQNLVEMFEKLRKKEKAEEKRKQKPEEEEVKLGLHQGVAKPQESDQGVAKNDKMQKTSNNQKFNSGKSAGKSTSSLKTKNILKSTPKVGKGAGNWKKDTNFHDIRKFFEKKVRQNQPPKLMGCQAYSAQPKLVRNVQISGEGLRRPVETIKYMAKRPNSSSSAHHQECDETGLVGGIRKTSEHYFEETQPTNQPPSLEISDQ